MDDDLALLCERVAALERVVGDIERRLVAIETRAHMREVRGQQAAPAGERPSSGGATTAGTDAARVFTFVGRTSLVLGGAYLLRALTDAGTFPRATGVAFGLAYAAFWLLAAWRAGGASRAGSAAFHALASVLIVFPLLWEATLRFHLFGQASAAASMGAFTCLGLSVAWHRRLRGVAWIVTMAGLLAALAFMMAGPGAVSQLQQAAAGLARGATEAPIGNPLAPMALYLALLGVFTLWLGYVLDWTWLRWPVALVADLTMVVMVADASQVWHQGEAGSVIRVQMVFFAAYLASFAARTLYRARRVVPFEVLQTVALLFVCFGGAVYLTATTGSSAVGLGISSLVFGACSYAVAFAFTGWRSGRWENFVFYASLAVVFTLAGIAITVGPATQAVAWSVLAVASAWAGKRYSTITVSSHATAYTIAAAVVSGLLAHATDGLRASVAVQWHPLLTPALFVLAGAAASFAVPLSAANESWGRASRIPKIVLAIVLLWSLCGLVCGLAVPLLAGQPGTAAADAAIAAGIRTVVIAVAVISMGWASRGFFAEGRWFMYVLLLAGGLKLLVEDLPLGRPSTLFLAFAAYGVALILGPRLARTTRAATDPSRPTATRDSKRTS